MTSVTVHCGSASLSPREGRGQPVRPSRRVSSIRARTSHARGLCRVRSNGRTVSRGTVCRRAAGRSEFRQGTGSAAPIPTGSLGGGMIVATVMLAYVSAHLGLRIIGDAFAASASSSLDHRMPVLVASAE